MADFYSGFERTFSPAYQRGIDRYTAQENADRQYALQQAAERRAQGEYDVRMADRARVDQAFDAYDLQQGGLDQGQQAGLKTTYGMNPSQAAAGLRQGGVQGLQGQLAQYDQPDNFDLQNAPAAPGMRLQAQAPTRLGTEQALGRIASAQRDTRGMRDSQNAQTGIRGDEIVAKRLRGNLDPAELDQVAGFLNQNDDILTLGDPDKNGFRQMSFVKPNGKSNFVNLSPLEQRRLLAANDLMDVDPKRAFELIGSVNKELSDSLRLRNEQTFKMGQEGNNRAYQSGQLANEQARIGIARGELGLRQKAMREMDPADVKALNELSAQISETQDPTERRRLEQLYQRQYGIAATKIGKVVPPQVSKGGGLAFKGVGDGGYFHDEAGNPVGQYGDLGVNPFGPDPRQDKNTQQLMARHGITVRSGRDGGTGQAIWGFQTPNGETFSTIEEAVQASQPRQQGRGLMGPPEATKPSTIEGDIYSGYGQNYFGP